jgi:hypothetical protein
MELVVKPTSRFTPHDLELYSEYVRFDDYIEFMKGMQVYNTILSPHLTDLNTIPNYSATEVKLDAVRFFASKGIEEITSILDNFAKKHIENGLRPYIHDSERFNSELRERMEPESDDSILQFATIYNVYQRLVVPRRTTDLITQTYNLLDAFKRITPSTEPFYVYRCYQRLQDGMPIMSNNGRIRSSIPIDTFLSTSILLRVCDFWCVPGPINSQNTTHRFGSEEGMRGNIIICIKIPPGTRGIAIVNYSQIVSQNNFGTDFGTDYSEFEYLLPPGGSLKYTHTSITHVSKNRERYEAVLQRYRRQWKTGLTNKNYPEETLPKTMTIHIYDYVGTPIVARTRVSRQESNDNGAGIGPLLPPAALPLPAALPSPQTISTESNFAVGDRVWVRHNVGEKWKRGTVESTNPLMVLPDKWTKAFTWKFMERLTESNALAGPEVESNELAHPAAESNVPAPSVVAQNVLAPEPRRAIPYNIDDSIQVLTNSGAWQNGKVSSIEPFKVLVDGLPAAFAIDIDQTRPMPSSLKSRILGHTRKAIRALRRLSNVSQRSTGTVAPPAVAPIQAIAYNIDDRVQVKATTGNWWMSGTVTSINPVMVLIDGWPVSYFFTDDRMRPMPPSFKSRILGHTTKAIADIKRRLPNVSRRSTGTLGGKRKQSKKRRKSLTNTNMKIGKRSPQKKTLRKR